MPQGDCKNDYGPGSRTVRPDPRKRDHVKQRSRHADGWTAGSAGKSTGWTPGLRAKGPGKHGTHEVRAGRRGTGKLKSWAKGNQGPIFLNNVPSGLQAEQR